MASGTITRSQSTGNNGGDMISYKYCRERKGMVYLDVFVDGKRIRKSTGRPATPANLKYVDKNWQAELERLSDNQPKSEAGKEMTVEEWGHRSLAMNAGNRKENTNKEYKQIFETRIVPVFGTLGLSEIKPSNIKVWQSQLQLEGLSGKRIHNIRMVLQGIMKDAVDDNLIPSSPFTNVDGVSQKPVKEKFPFTLNEAKMLIQHSDGWFRNFLAVAFFTGMRTGELMALKWSDITLTEDGGVIKVRESIRRGKTTDTKTEASQDREVDILPPVYEALKKQFTMTGLSGGIVFKHSRGEGFKDASGIRQRHWEPLLKRLKIAHRELYNTRHTFATMMISRGEDITWVQHMLGHADSNITLSAYTKYIKREGVKRASFLDEVEVFKTDSLENYKVSTKRDGNSNLNFA